MKFPYLWKLADGYPAKGVKDHGLKVFGTFVCGGGSTMGYKLAGFNHLGGVEIDKKIADVYQKNHNPKYFYNEDLRIFNARNDLPDELYDLELLDGSPPCSSFSSCGVREKDWGKKKKFTEGQALQTLDDLVFIYVDTAIKLRPKVVLLENVTGLLQGNARAYARKIFDKLKSAGYSVQIFKLNAASMGVPQKRERVFFIGRRNDLKLKPVKMSFNQKLVTFGEIKPGKGKPLGKDVLLRKYRQFILPADIKVSQIKHRLNEKPIGFSRCYLHKHKVPMTLVSGNQYALAYSDHHVADSDFISNIGSHYRRNTHAD